MNSSKGAKALEESEAGSESYGSHTYVAFDWVPGLGVQPLHTKTSRTANGSGLIFIPGRQALVLHLC